MIFKWMMAGLYFLIWDTSLNFPKHGETFKAIMLKDI